jgi:DnaJ-class molecular chaperone
MKLEVSLKEALIGFQRQITLLDLSNIKLNCTTIVNPYDSKIIKGCGFSSIGKLISDSPDNVVGNLIVNFHIKFPDSISDEKKASISSLQILD